jgi:hypothetical protein
MLFIFLDLVLALEYNLTTTGYQTLTTSDTPITIHLDYNLDTVFLFDSLTNAYKIEVRALDMTEFGTILPNSTGFTSFFLTDVRITPLDPNATVTLELYVLPEGHCSHRLFAYSTSSRRTHSISWTTVPKTWFNVCWLTRGSSSTVEVRWTPSASSSASYAGPDEWAGGIPDKSIESGESTISVANGTMIRVHGLTGSETQKFELTTTGSTNQTVYQLPYYFLMLPKGNDFAAEVPLTVSQEDVPSSGLSAPAVAGVVISSLSMLSVIVAVVRSVMQLPKPD